MYYHVNIEDINEMNKKVNGEWINPDSDFEFNSCIDGKVEVMLINNNNFNFLLVA